MTIYNAKDHVGELLTGENVFKCELGDQIDIISDQQFCCYAVASDGTKLSILGPFSPNDRRFVIRKIQHDLIMVVASGLFMINYIPRELRMHTVDGTPVEVPVRFSRPESMEDVIKRVLLNERLQREGMQEETPEEMLDFEIDDNEPLLSPYQLQDMEPELPEFASGVDDIADPPAAVTGAGDSQADPKPDSATK